MLSLIGQSAGQPVPVPPQLHEAAAWLATEFPDVCEHLVEREPAIILRSDVATIDVGMRVLLIDTMLGQLDRGDAIDPFWLFPQSLSKLTHPDLHRQVESWIADRGRSMSARYHAIDFVRYCQLGELLPMLVVIALDPSEDYVVRSHAAYVVGQLGRDMFGSQLLLLAKGEAGDDKEDELKGSGLLATWPGSLTARDVFALITYPKR